MHTGFIIGRALWAVISSLDGLGKKLCLFRLIGQQPSGIFVTLAKME